MRKSTLLPSSVVIAMIAMACECVPVPSSTKPDDQSTVHSTQPSMGPGSAATARDIDAMILSQGSVTFRSWNGKWIGADCDTDLTFLPGGTVHMFEYGVGVNGYTGTYAINEQGIVKLQLSKFSEPWPAMALRRDSSSLFLVAIDGSGFIFGNRGGATLPGGEGGYWPFRPLPKEQEAVVRERIGKWE